MTLAAKEGLRIARWLYLCITGVISLRYYRAKGALPLLADKQEQTAKTKLDGVKGRLGAVGDPKLLDHVVDVQLGRAGAYRKPPGYLPVSPPLRQKGQYLRLTWRECLV